MVQLRHLIMRAWKQILATALIMAIAAPSVSQTLELVEVDRFKARFPGSLTYAPEFCGLWILGSSTAMHRYTLSGVRAGTKALSFDFEAGGMSEGGWLFLGGSGGIFDGNIPRRKGVLRLPNELAGLRPGVTGGEILAEGEIFASFEAPYLAYYPTTQKFTIFGRDNRPGTYRDVARDPVTGRLFAIFRHAGEEELVIFNRSFVRMTSLPLDTIGGWAESVTVQPETGDLFVGFHNPRAVEGDVVRLALQGLEDDEQLSNRPAYSCNVS